MDEKGGRRFYHDDLGRLSCMNDFKNRIVAEILFGDERDDVIVHESRVEG